MPKFINFLIRSLVSTDKVSDGYHTFSELYESRLMLNAALFNQWAASKLYDVHKSLLHHDGEKPFGSDDWFVVCATLPTGQITFHYRTDHWDLFRIPETDKMIVPFDGHDTADVLGRLRSLNLQSYYKAKK